MRWAICLSLLICSTCLNRLYSQEAPFLFSRVGEEESWGNHSFNDIVQDKYGFVWFATYTGLFKYDGANITPYGLTPSLPKRLKSSRITSLLLDSKHRLWVGTTASGFFQYNYQDDSFTEFAVSGHIRAIVEGKEGVLYIGTDKGILQLNPEERKVINISKEKWAEEKLNPPQVNALRVDFDGSLWVGHSCGLSKIVWGENKNEVVIYPLNFSENTKDANLDCPCSVTSIKPSLVEKNVLWVGTARGLVKVKFEGDDPTRSTSSLIENTDASLSDKTFVIRIHIENAHQMWVGTNEGLKLIDPVTGSGKSYTSNSDNPYGLSNDKVHSLYKDKFNNLWVGTEKGVNKLNLRGSPFYKTAIFKNFARQYRLTGVVPSSHPNKAWVSTRGGGLYNYDFELDSIEKVRLEDYGDKQLGRFISALDQDNQQSIWLATLGGGIIRVFEEAFHEESRSALPTEIFSTKHGLATSHIMSIHASRDRNIWFSYWRKGLGRINSRTKEIGQYTVVGDPAIDLKEYHFTCFAENEENHLWVGTSENGLFKFSYKASEDSLYLLDYLQHQLNVPNS
ncbi:MAG: two-component regulator propeller domain-containing protein, partial [Bacteroidota bacterium]